MNDVREINVTTGEETTRNYTQAELDAIAAYTPPPAVRVATARQFKFALWKKGFITLAEISSPELPAIAVAALDYIAADTETRAAAISTWASMTVIPEDDPLLELMRVAANKTPQDKIDVFDIALSFT